MNLPEVALTPLKQAAAVGALQREAELERRMKGWLQKPSRSRLLVTLHNLKVLLLKTKLTYIIKHREAELASD